MKKRKNKIITGVIIIILLTFAFWYGGDISVFHPFTLQYEDNITEPEKNISENLIKDENIYYDNENNSEKQDVDEMTLYENVTYTDKIEKNEKKSSEKITVHNEKQISNEEYSKEQGIVINENTLKEQNQEVPVKQGKPLPGDPENTVISDKELVCTLSVRCDMIFKNIERLDNKKAEIVPKDGVIFAEKTVTFYEGESVFNVLVREMKRNKIHLEFVNTPLYKSAYIEGIANIYEFECGELSGWMYKVNDWFPNYGCSRYQIKTGDKIEWVYTCDLGKDVGGAYSARNGY